MTSLTLLLCPQALADEYYEPFRFLDIGNLAARFPFIRASLRTGEKKALTSLLKKMQWSVTLASVAESRYGDDVIKGVSDVIVTGLVTS